MSRRADSAICPSCQCRFGDSNCVHFDSRGPNDPWYAKFKLDTATTQLAESGPNGFGVFLPTWLSDPPCVSAYHSISQSVPYDTLWPLLFNKEKYDTDSMHCVDDKTEILTSNGWKFYHELDGLEEVLTLNHQSGLSEWQALKDLHVFPEEERALLHMEGAHHSSLTTANHRWPVLRYQYDRGRRQGFVKAWATSDTFWAEDHVPTSARNNDLPLTPKWEDAFVELVAWFWTEGCLHKLRNGSISNTTTIVQSQTKNAGNCDRIKAVLTELFGPASSEPFNKRGIRYDPTPRWKVAPNTRAISFRLNAAAGALLQKAAPRKIVSISWLRELTPAQLELFIQVSMLADNSGPRALSQKNRAAAEVFQVAVLLSGRGSSLTRKPPCGNSSEMWRVSLKKRQTFAPCIAAKFSHQFKMEWVEHVGIVWCPETPNGTWLARRKGHVYFTGNSTDLEKSSRLTFNTAGVYFITLNVTWNKKDVLNGDVAAFIRRDSSDLIAIESQRYSDEADIYLGQSVKIQSFFEAGQYVEALVHQDGKDADKNPLSGRIDTEQFSPIFSAVFLRPEP